MLNSGNHLNISLHALFGKWMKFLGICLIIQDNVYDRKMINRGILVFLFSAALVVLSGLSQYFFGIEFLRNKNMTVMNDKVTRAITSSFDHYNSFAGYLVVVMSLIIALLLENASLGPRTVSLFTLLIFSGTAIMLTFSRGSWLALAVSFIFSSVLSRKKIQWFMPIFLMCIAVLFFPQIRERLHLTFKFGGDADRFKIWAAALKMINDHPFFGMGVGTFMANFSKYLPGKPLYAHNCYLQIWAETGVFSLISFLGFTCSIIILGVKKFIYSKDFLLLGLLAGFIGFLVRSFFDTNLYSLQLAFLLWVWVGMIIRKLNIANERAPE